MNWFDMVFYEAEKKPWMRKVLVLLALVSALATGFILFFGGWGG